MSQNKEEQLKSQLDLVTKMYGEFLEDGRLSQKSLSDGKVDGIGFVWASIRDELEQLIRELSFRLQMERSFPKKGEEE